LARTVPVWVSTWLSSAAKRPVASVALRVRSSAIAGSLAFCGDAALQFRHLVLRHGEFDVDRRELGDHRDAVGVAAADQVADIDRAQADAARRSAP
jgi:hypothetical protein